MCIILNSLFLDCFNDESCKNVYYYSRHFVKNVGEIFELKMSLYYEIVIRLALEILSDSQFSEIQHNEYLMNHVGSAELPLTE